MVKQLVSDSLSGNKEIIWKEHSMYKAEMYGRNGGERAGTAFSGRFPGHEIQRVVYLAADVKSESDITIC